ncbi:4593_t:CDS:2 [Gigaspora margarita]|uniref:4593_t:CDS:1 n=1 Tax=Gigaspora margarita TaxID=4874 RepID=A0ABN7UN87_GIGMA|nr:4593_t:CDS:2 [Gigaspora margarita]
MNDKISINKADNIIAIDKDSNIIAIDKGNNLITNDNDNRITNEIDEISIERDNRTRPHYNYNGKIINCMESLGILYGIGYNINCIIGADFLTNTAFITVVGYNFYDNESTPIAMLFGKELFYETGEKFMSILVAISAFGRARAINPQAVYTSRFISFRELKILNSQEICTTGIINDDNKIIESQENNQIIESQEDNIPNEHMNKLMLEIENIKPH